MYQSTTYLKSDVWEECVTSDSYASYGQRELPQNGTLSIRSTSSNDKITDAEILHCHVTIEEVPNCPGI